VTQCTTEHCNGTHSGSGGGVGKQWQKSTTVRSSGIIV
jgi:hypothetical protein